MRWQPPFFLTALAVALLTLVAAAAGALQAQREAAQHQIAGTWHAIIVMDSIRMSPGRSGRERSNATADTGSVELFVGWPSSEQLGWFRRGFQGRHSLHPARLTGQNPVEGRTVLAWRHGADSVRLFLGGSCCHTNGLIVAGRIQGDTMSGRWLTDSDGWGAWGSIFLVRRGAT